MALVTYNATIARWTLLCSLRLASGPRSTSLLRKCGAGAGAAARLRMGTVTFGGAVALSPPIEWPSNSRRGQSLSGARSTTSAKIVSAATPTTSRQCLSRRTIVEATRTRLAGPLHTVGAATSCLETTSTCPREVAGSAARAVATRAVGTGRQVAGSATDRGLSCP